MKDFELKLISKLMRNSRRGDRELSRKLGVTQPTITRTRSARANSLWYLRVDLLTYSLFSPSLPLLLIMVLSLLRN